MLCTRHARALYMNQQSLREEEEEEKYYVVTMSIPLTGFDNGVVPGLLHCREKKTNNERVYTVQLRRINGLRVNQSAWRKIL